LQSTSDKELKALGRIHSYGAFLQSFKWAREAGFKNINVDLITAVPGQSVSSWEKSLAQVIALKPEHVSAYSLIIEPGTPFEALEAEGKLELPGEEEERQMYHRTREILRAAGYERYEISNYARPGYECRHNIGYWRGTDYLGLGLGAASLLDGRRFSNPRDMKAYTAFEPEGAAWYYEEEMLDAQAQMEEFMFLGLRMVRGVSEKEFYKKFGKKMMAVYGNVVKKYEKVGLLKRKDGRIFLTEAGMDVANTVMADFLL
jgi:oxygen-independent coproporphyrinogen-3 oxidase